MNALTPGGTATATVLACQGRLVQLEQNGICLAARVAFGCLVEPEPGDAVLAVRVDGSVWVTTVLERYGPAPARLLTEGDLHIASRTANVAITAGRDVLTTAAGSMNILADTIDLHAATGRFVIDDLVQIGRRLSLFVAKLRSVGEIVETFADHVLTRTKRTTRFVEESDHLQAGTIDHRAEGAMQLSAKAAFITADAIVRVDSDQIHLG